MRTFIKMSDPGHGWLKVSKKLFLDVGVPVSGFSYASKTLVYLEEDCDAPSFLKVYQEKFGPYQVRERHSRGHSKIRSLHDAPPLLKESTG